MKSLKWRDLAGGCEKARGRERARTLVGVRIWRRICAIVLTLSFSLVAVNAVHAEGLWGATTNSNDRDECTEDSEVCYADGARWQYYEWPQGKTSAMYIEGSAGGLTGGEYIGSCAEEGGYWRYAMVKHGTESPSRQIGFINVSGNTNAKFDDVRYNNDFGNGNYIYYTDGGEEYYTYYGYSMGYVRDRYYEAKEAERAKYGYNIKFIDEFYLLEGTWYGDGIAAFCGSKGDDAGEVTPDPEPEEPEKPEIVLEGECGDWVGETRYLESGYTEGWTDVLIKAQNADLGSRVSGSGWQSDRVYARPGDTVAYKGCYYPGAQWLAEREVTVVDGAHSRYSNTANTNISLAGSLGGAWGNGFTILNNGETVTFESFENGDAAIQSYDTNFTVSGDDVGKSQLETIRSSSPIYAKIETEKHRWWCTPYGECTHTNVFATGATRSGSNVDNVSVSVPYNFSNSVSVNLYNDVVYAGETSTGASVVATVGAKWNAAVSDTYATRVDGAKVQVVSYVRSSDDARGDIGAISDAGLLCGSGLLGFKDDLCAVGVEWDGSLNDSSDLAGASTTVVASATGVNTFDAEAGEYYCMVAAVYPAKSGGDTNLDASGNGQWYVSAPKCRKVAKRPSFNVYGGSLYSAGDVYTTSSVKRNLAGYGYVTDGSRSTVFGSWVEQAVLSNGLVRGLGSGASMGFLATSSGAVGGAFDGSSGASGGVMVLVGSGSFEGRNVSYCEHRTPLSFANYSTSLMSLICPSAEATGRMETAVTVADGGALMDALGVEATTDDVVIDGMVISDLYTVRTTGSVLIQGNIEYADSELSDFASAPRAAIYASGDIVIACNVERVDAILMTPGKVWSCGGYGGSDAQALGVEATERSRPLTIRGAVIAGQLVLGRVYGAGTGADSSTPAEVINYDSSVVEWAREAADGGSDGSGSGGSGDDDSGSSDGGSGDVTGAVELVETYVQELAPRM